MSQEKAKKDYLVKKLYRKLALVEIESQLIQISCNLMDDEVYTVDEAVHELIEIINLVEMERQVIMTDIKFS